MRIHFSQFFCLFCCGHSEVEKRELKVGGGCRGRNPLKEIGFVLCIVFHGSRVSHTQKWDFLWDRRTFLCLTLSSCTHEENTRLSPSQPIFGKEIAKGRLEEPFILDSLPCHFDLLMSERLVRTALSPSFFLFGAKKRFNLQGIKDMVPHGVHAMYYILLGVLLSFFDVARKEGNCE